MPLVGAPTVCVLIYVFYLSYTAPKNAYVRSVIRRGAPIANFNLIQKGLMRLKQSDPDFNTEAFLTRVRAGFLKLQHAWCAQDLVPVRPFISDGIHERFSLQFHEQRTFGYRNQMDGIYILGCSLALVECGRVFDVATVRIAARAKDVRVSADDGHKIEGTEEPDEFVEYWSFIRTHGARTMLNKAGLIEGNCPNCGAPVEMNAGAKCQHCQALLRSGQFDWVLAEITQENEWKVRSVPPPGTLKIAKTDPGFHIQDLEDVTSVVFWRKAQADRLGKVDSLRKVASAEMCGSYEERLKPNADGRRTFLSDCAVNAVDAVGVITDPTEDLALVEVCWMGRMCESNEHGAMRFNREWLLQHTLFVLSRKSGVMTTPADCVSSAHCPNCGGAHSDDASNACEFCGTVLNDGTRGWVLSAIWPSASPQARGLVARAVAGSQREQQQFGAMLSPARSGGTGSLAWMVRSVVTTGNLWGKSVRETLDKAAARKNIPAAKVEQMIQMAAAGQLDVPEPDDAVEALAWLSEMAACALATGGISKEETSLLRATAARYGLSRADVNQIVGRSRKEAYVNAKAALRTAKTLAREVR